MVGFRLQRVFREVFGDAGLEISYSTKKGDIPSWDSLADVKLILGIEAAYCIRFTTLELAQLESVQDILVALRQRGIKQEQQ